MEWFLDIRLVDVIDVLLVAYIMYAIYRLVRGTVAINIILSIFAFIILWLVVRALKMSLLSAIMDSFVSIGLLALIVIFQQEARRFLVLVSSRYDFVRRLGIFKQLEGEGQKTYVGEVCRACESMSKQKVGALIVFARNVGLKEYASTGEAIGADFSQRLIETIFFKNTPLHDGAMIVDRHRILAAACILPVSQNMRIPKHFGLRHRSALGITEQTDAVAVVVSEETGRMTVFEGGSFRHVKSAIELAELLEKI